MTASDAQCVTVLAAAGLGTWFASLPEGLATTLGAGGRPMSAGERQRLGLARVLLAGDQVLLLDEPTAHIDPASSAGLLDELVGATGSRSVLVVSHEPDLGRLVDEVVTLDGGRVVARSSIGRRTSPPAPSGAGPGAPPP
jgi:ABC-type transport system involved in cytochrome bd biosynthesis fused ATPase/permease subunit